MNPRARPSLLLLIVASFITSAAPSANAQAPLEPSLDAQRFMPSGSYHGFVTVPTAQLLPEKRFGFDVIFSVAANPLQQSTSDFTREVGAIDALFAFHGRVGFAFTKWAEIDLTWAFLQFARTAGGLGAIGGDASEVFSFGDLQIEGRFKPLFEEKHFISLMIRPFVTFPTGNRKLFLTSGVPTVGVDLTVSKTIWRFNLAGHVGYRLKEPGYAQIGVNLVADDEILYGLGVGFAILPERLDVNLELAGVGIVGPGLGAVGLYDGRAAAHSPLELFLNARIKTDKGIDVVVGGGPGLTPGAGTPTVRFFAGVSYAPSRDRDKDGILDADDQCVDDPEDMDDFEDQDGCPEPDNDLDGILDAADGCPNDAEDMDGFEDEDGCPDVDNDGDRILDLSDACPDEPEDIDHFEDEDGCPDPDNDQDGVLDRDDLCPLDAEDMDGFDDEDGCPDPDNDDDGFLDADDLCPDEPENVNDFKDDDGCPDDVIAVIHEGKIVILEKVLFVTARDRILKRSERVLGAVRDRLDEALSIKKIRIEGHTDDQGSDVYNQRLSEKRATAILRHLVKAGIDPSRLEAVGYGESKPIDTNKTDEGRERNRRVEFTILQQDSTVEMKGVDLPSD
jgi:outer membrane protein OmpA-like peptidoglycan-associated protein